MIEVDGLAKYYGKLAAIKDVSFRVESGEIVGFLGPNGAGKTTTMRVLTCFSPPSRGTARIQGLDVRSDSLKIRERIGYLPENVPLYDWMRVRSYLEFVARAKRVAAPDRGKEVARVSQAVGLDQVMGRIIRSLSKGFRQRVGLAQALIGDPPILILDEPTIGLDPRQIREIRRLIKGFAQNRTVILSTHILPEVSQVCSRVIIINKGSIIAEDTPDNLIGRHTGSSRCTVSARAPEVEMQELLTAVPGVLSVQIAGTSPGGEAKLMIEAEPQTEVCPALARAVLERGWDLLELKTIHASLEDVFIDLVTEESQEDTIRQEEAETEVA